jgi:hypothetical protein
MARQWLAAGVFVWVAGLSGVATALPPPPVQPEKPLPVKPIPIVVDAGAVPCVATLSGATTGSYPCKAVGVWDATKKHGGVAIVSNAQVQGINVLSAALTNLPSAPSAGTYTTPTTAATVNVVVTLVPQAWLASNSGTSVGAASFTISSVKTVATTDGGTVYEVHGSVTATCVTPNGVTNPGSTTVSITF